MAVLAEFAVDIRSHDGWTTTVPTIRDALHRAKEDPTIWKISFDSESGERVRLVFDELTEFWVYEDILETLLPCDIDEGDFLKED